MQKELIDKARTLAAENFRKGMNCAESVFKAIYDLQENVQVKTDLPSEVIRLVTGFGGGIGFSGNVCGAITGGIAALGLAYGFGDPSEVKVHDRIGECGVYRLFNQLPHRFKQRFGTIICSELIKPFEPLSQDMLRNCMRITLETAGMVMELLLESREKGISNFKFCENIASLE